MEVGNEEKTIFEAPQAEKIGFSAFLMDFRLPVSIYSVFGNFKNNRKKVGIYSGIYGHRPLYYVPV